MPGNDHAKDVIKAENLKLDLMECQRNKCAKLFVKTQKQRMESQMFMQKMMFQVILGKISVDEFKQQVLDYMNNIVNSKNSISLMKCALNKCKKEMDESLDFIIKKADVKADKKDVKELEDYLRVFHEATVKLVTEAAEGLEAKLNKKK